jgi:hypothetical protein
MKARVTTTIVIAVLGVAAVAGAVVFNTVTADEFDPGDTHHVQGTWLEGIGCPTDAFITPFDPDTGGPGPAQPYTDPA